jgi:2-polyprenyl-3-methyl-5-hydroxy-6-metoxy-1,4-benzoquinol methylase
MPALWPDLSHRHFAPEQMDAPDCDPARLDQTYNELASINHWLSRARTLLSRHVLAHAARTPDRPVRFADVGCGGGDLLPFMHQRARDLGLRMEIVGVDANPRAVSFARARLGLLGLDRCGVSILQGSAFALDDVGPPFDYVFCNHLLHHFPDGEVPQVLGALHRASQRRLLVSDLLRSPAAYAGYTALAAFFFHSSYTFDDGRLSIRKGFHPSELVQAASSAGISRAEVGTLAPGRVYLVADAAANAAPLP